MVDYEDFQVMSAERAKSQDVNDDMRESAREQLYFVEKVDGQWEPDIIQKMSGKPRYTDDRCNPILDSICGEIEDNDFSIKVTPSSGKASKDTAATFAGLIRNIESISSADLIYSTMARMMVTCGMHGVELEQDYIDGDSVDQDLFVRDIPDFINRVWFDQSSIAQNNEDARFVFIDENITKEEFKDKFDDDNPKSVGSSARSEAYTDKPDIVTISRCYYKKPIKIDIVQMSNGAVYRDDEKLAMLMDEFAAQGITETKRRTRTTHRVYQRWMDASGWLNEPQETVFEILPVFGCYANYKVIDGKAVMRGAIAKAMDQQRVHNMAFSREVEEVVLSPRAKFWGTPEMRRGHDKTLSTLNTNNHPWQDMNHDPNMPQGPMFLGGAQVNQGLSQLSQMSAQSIDLATGAFSPQLANNANLQSGVALDAQIEKSNTSTVKYYKAVQVTLTAVGKCLVNCIPRSYDATREQLILEEDGQSEMVMLNQPYIDEQTGQKVTLNDLSLGEYDAACSYGPAFKNRQQATTDTLLAHMAVDPSLVEISRDIVLANSSDPGMDLVAERARALQIQNKVIPFDQMTDEEQAAEQQKAQQPPPPDPNMLIAQAEMGKAEAEQLSAQTKQQESQFNQQVKIAEHKIENRKLALAEQEQRLDVQKFMREKDDKYNVEAAKIQQEQQKIDNAAKAQVEQLALKLTELELKFQTQLNKEMEQNTKTVTHSV